ncbi:S8 family serine peptidase [Streptomyces sp. NPDC017979]|uniref:S8 family serine peptidase n=1 Tax=Streptomyces sp. NPDC017979 TaxID=3365024 RepID=UPI0037AE6563
MAVGFTAPVTKAEKPPSPAPSGDGPRIVLVTGDTVVLDRGGQVAQIEPGPGRDRIPVQISRRADRTLVVPMDAEPLIRTGRLDERLFDVTELSRPEYRKRGPGLPLVVRYRGTAKAPEAELSKVLGTADRLGHELPAVNARAVRVGDAAGAARVWAALTDTTGPAGAGRTTAQGEELRAAEGVEKIWLDRVRRAGLDRSTTQIGAPAAWQSGLDGQGVKIAVLDTGVDDTHPDLAGRQLAERNFTGAPDAVDRRGHGTHVASIATGSGAKSGGKFKGVAPAASYLDGKVLDDNGYGLDSEILAGMEWAVAQGADVVNMSITGNDFPGLDVLEEGVNRLTATSGTLFTTIAGNNYNDGIDSPGSAEAGLTLGGVDHSDVLMPMSDRGPTRGDGGLKPDATAPGDNVVAAAVGAGDPATPGYVANTGTSMAAPHAAGAAALLKQKHPTWQAGALKGALAGSAKPGPYTVFEQGHGRIDVAAALARTVLVESPPLSFGRQRWPRHDDTATTRKVTYRNTGTAPVTLDLALTGTGPDGKPASPGVFALSTDRVTVPAGGTASVDVTASGRVSTADGLFTVQLTATGGGQTVRTLGSLDLEVESYDVTVKHIGRDGQPSLLHSTSLTALTGPAQTKRFDVDASVLRLPRGNYFLDSQVRIGNWRWPFDLISQPRLVVDRDTTVTVDARTARPVRVTVPDAAATPVDAKLARSVDVDGQQLRDEWTFTSFDDVRTAHLGPALPTGDRAALSFHGTWRKSPAEAYRLAFTAGGATLPTGVTRDFLPADLSTLHGEFGASTAGLYGMLDSLAVLDGSSGDRFSQRLDGLDLPGPYTLHVNARGVRWNLSLRQYDPQDRGADLHTGPRRYAPGKATPVRLGIGVFGPGVAADPNRPEARSGLTRSGDVISGCLPMFADGPGRWGQAPADAYATTLHRNGQPVFDGKGSLCDTPLTVPADRAEYRLSTTETRSGFTSVSTKVAAEWTFASQRTAAPVDLPVSTVRFSPELASDSTAPAGASSRVPVTVEGAAADGGVRSLTVRASYDDGRTWTKVPLVDGAVTVTNPAAGQSVALRAELVDTAGNTLQQTIHDAYRGR